MTTSSSTYPTTALPPKALRVAIAGYLQSAPLFMAFIRSQEIVLFQKYQKYIKGKILDFGCGDGFFATLAFKRTKTMTGVDLIGNPRISEAAPRQVYDHIVLYDGQKLPLADKSFDTVVSNCVFEHIPQIEKSVGELNRVLKPGGYCVTSVMTQPWDHMLLGQHVLGDWYAKLMRKKQEHHSLLSVPAWEKIFQHQGFKVIARTGYVSRKCAVWLDVAHYLSLPSLLWRKLFGTWTFWPQVTALPLTHWIAQVVSQPDTESAAQFYVLKKVSKVSASRSQKA